MLTNREAIDPVRIGKKVRKMRRDLELSLEAQALRMGCSRNHLSRIEQGNHMPTLEWLAKFCDSMNMHITEILQ